MTSIKGVLFLKNVDGEMEWVNGDSGNEGKYEGEIENWKPNGLGIMIYPSGSKYVGSWKNGKRHGKGQMTHTDTSSNWGEYKDGDFWNGNIYDKNGNIKVKRVNGKTIEQ